MPVTCRQRMPLDNSVKEGDIIAFQRPNGQIVMVGLAREEPTPAGENEMDVRIEWLDEARATDATVVVEVKRRAPGDG